MLLRKIDYSVQLVLGVIMLLSLPVFFLYGFLAGLFLLGFIQLVSAVSNTSGFLTNGLGNEICNYWKYTGLIFASLFLCIPLAELFNPDDVQVLGAIGITASVPVSVYYLNIYKKLIRHLAFKNELEGLIKSKH